MATLASYQGSCHCGAVRFAVEADLSSVVSCNCSMCGRLGSLLTFVPAAQFHLDPESKPQTDYQFGKKRLHHPFCPTCGVHVIGHGMNGDQAMYAVNVRCLDGVDPATLTLKHFDGKSL